MCWGEGDLGTSFGSFNDAQSKEYKVAKIARKVCWEYQRSLWDEQLDSSKIVHDGHLVVYDNIALLSVDQFAGTFNGDGYLGKQQWSGMLQVIF